MIEAARLDDYLSALQVSVDCVRGHPSVLNCEDNKRCSPRRVAGERNFKAPVHAFCVEGVLKRPGAGAEKPIVSHELILNSAHFTRCFLLGAFKLCP
jgi:hypothetical protein